MQEPKVELGTRCVMIVPISGLGKPRFWNLTRVLPILRIPLDRPNGWSRVDVFTPLGLGIRLKEATAFHRLLFFTL